MSNQDIVTPRCSAVSQVLQFPGFILQLGTIPTQITKLEEAPNYVLLPSTKEGTVTPVGIWHYRMYHEGAVEEEVLAENVFNTVEQVLGEHGQLHFSKSTREMAKKHIWQMVKHGGYKGKPHATQRASSIYPMNVQVGEDRRWTRAPGMLLMSNLAELTVLPMGMNGDEGGASREFYMKSEALPTGYAGTVTLLDYPCRWTLEHPFISLRHVMLPEDVIREIQSLVDRRMPFMTNYITDWEVYDPVNSMRVGGENPRKPLRSLASVKARLERNLTE